MNKFNSKVVLITGASSGIGYALAKEFAKEGAHLILLARRMDRLTALARELENSKSKVVILKCDVTLDNDLENSIQIAAKTFDKIDIVVANAGWNVRGSLEKLDLSHYRRQMETNVFGVLKTIYASLPSLKRSQGSLVLIGSVAGYISVPESSAYSMSKHAIHALANAITPEFNALGITVTLIAPGFVVSEIREVDNEGKYTPLKEKPKPSFFRMDTDKAARQIIQAIANKKTEKIITTSGKFLVSFRRIFPKLLSQIIKQLYSFSIAKMNRKNAVLSKRRRQRA